MHVQPSHRRVAWNPRVPFYVIVLLYLALPAFLLLAGIPLIGAVDHRYIGLDYLLIGAMGIFLPRSVTFAMLMMEFVIDCVSQICIVYQLAPTQLLALIHYLPFVPTSRIAGGSALILLGITVCMALSTLRPRPDQEFRTMATLLCTLAVFIGADLCTGRNFLLKSDLGLIPRVARSPVVSVARKEALYSAALRNPTEGRDTPAHSASSQLMTAFPPSTLAAHKVNVVLVLVESWGILDDGKSAHGLIDAYESSLITSNYLLVHGTIPFHGPTVAGEARELCESEMGLAVLRISSDRANTCLPELMQQQGYHTVAMHGFAGGMFLRSTWYPRVGFDETWFLPDLEKRGLARCEGAFPGICDSSIAQFIGQRLLAAPADQPQFIYWVTLNSHIPVPARTDIADDGSCASSPKLKLSTALCSWYRLIRAVHKGVAQDSIKLIGRPTVFVVVGDHAPPFGDPPLRQQFSGTEVPYVMLVPSELSHHRPAVLGDRTLMAKTAPRHVKPEATREANPRSAAL